MAYRDLLIHTITVKRPSGAIDRFGQEVDDATLVGTYIGRLTSGKGGRANTERSTGVFEVTHTIFVEPDADIVEDDVLSVTDRDERVLLPDANVYHKRMVYNGEHRHHLEVIVLVQRGEH